MIDRVKIMALNGPLRSINRILLMLKKPFAISLAISLCFNLASCESSSPDLSVSRRNKKVEIAIGVYVGVVLLLIGLGLLCLFILRRKGSRIGQSIHIGPSIHIDQSIHIGQSIRGEVERVLNPRLTMFSHSELSQATNNFNDDYKLGEGGFGGVYRVELTNPERIVAVKKLKSESQQGKKEFIAEIQIISRITHKNLVKLNGWCQEGSELLLVYEFMPNGSLDNHLFDRNLPPLPWAKRYNIACGLASGLQYLHQDLDQCVVHRDIKSSNVMLDSNFNPRLGDFGMARFTEHGKSMNLTVAGGTFGYLAPEIFSGEKASIQSDVYSFGIVVLEIVTGKKPIFGLSGTEPIRQVQLVQWVQDIKATYEILAAIDERLERNFSIEQAMLLLEVGLWCYVEATSRPSMSQVMLVLKEESLRMYDLIIQGSTSNQSEEYYTPPGGSLENSELPAQGR